MITVAIARPTLVSELAQELGSQSVAVVPLRVLRLLREKRKIRRVGLTLEEGEYHCDHDRDLRASKNNATLAQQHRENRRQGYMLLGRFSDLAMEPSALPKLDSIASSPLVRHSAADVTGQNSA